MTLQDMRKTYDRVLKKCPLLLGIPEESLDAALSCMEAQVLAVTKGEVILAQGDPFSGAYYVLEGCLEGSFLNRAFDEITLAQFLPGSLCGESFAALPESRSKVQLAAVSDSVLLRLCLTPLLACSCSTCGVPFRHQILANLVQALSRQNIYLNQKVQILGQKSAEDRILLYLESLPLLSDGSRMLPLSRTELAASLGLNRSAMSRSLSRMEQSGVIAVNGRRIRVLRREGTEDHR